MLRLAPLLCLVACAEPSVLVTVEGRATIAALATLDVTVDDGSGEVAETRFAVAGVALPATFVVATEGRSGALTIAAQGRDADGVLIALGAVAVEAGGQSAATLQLDPSDRPVNSTIRGDQQLVAVERGYAGGDAVASGGGGGGLVVFESNRSVRARLIGADGLPAINGNTRTELDFELDADSLDLVGTPVVAPAPADLDGGYLVAWERSILGTVNTQLWRYLVAADGSVGSVAPLVADDDVTRRFARLATVPGGWVAVWQEPSVSFDEYAGEPRLTRIDAATGAVATPVVVAASEVGHAYPQVAASGDGVLVVWEDTTGDAPQLWARGFDAALNALGPAAALVTTGVPRAPRLIGHDGGYALVYWDDVGDDHPWLLQRLDPAGALDGAPIEIARTDRGSTLGEAESTSLDLRGDGALAVVWASGDPAAEAYDIFVRGFAGDGQPCGDARQVNTTSAGLQQLPSVAGFGDDAFLVTWNDASASEDDVDGSAVRYRIVYLDCP